MKMAGYSTVDAAFWTDPDVVDNFTPEDKYFYLYLLTCPLGNISGCFPASIKQISSDTGYSKETVERLIERFEKVHQTVAYCKETKEILICKWWKYHWTTSEKYLTALGKRIGDIKCPGFKEYLREVLEAFEDGGNRDTVSIPYRYGMDTSYTSTYTYPSTSSELGNKGRVGGAGGREGKRDDPAPQEPVITILLNDGSEYPVYRDYVDEMQALYPAADVLQELKKMKAWSINNPTKRKTKSGIKRFIGNWLAKEQDRGGREGTTGRYGNGTGEAKRGRYDLNPGKDAENDPRWANVRYDISE